jgi:hypothetical protein
LEPFCRDLEPYGRDSEPYCRDLEPFCRDLEPYCRDLEPYGRDSEPYGRDLEPHCRDPDRSFCHSTSHRGLSVITSGAPLPGRTAASAETSPPRSPRPAGSGGQHARRDRLRSQILGSLRRYEAAADRIGSAGWPHVFSASGPL